MQNRTHAYFALMQLGARTLKQDLADGAEGALVVDVQVNATALGLVTWSNETGGLVTTEHVAEAVASLTATPPASTPITAETIEEARKGGVFELWTVSRDRLDADGFTLELSRGPDVVYVDCYPKAVGVSHGLRGINGHATIARRAITSVEDLVTFLDTLVAVEAKP